MIPGTLPRPIDGEVRYFDGRLTGWRVFEHPALALPRQNGNLVRLAAGRVRHAKPPAPGPATALKVDAIAGATVSFPPDDEGEE